MDRRTIIGFGVIILLVFGWSMYNQKVDGERAAIQKRQADSAMRVKQAEDAKRLAAKKKYDDSVTKATKDSTGKPANLDSLHNEQRKQSFGAFVNAMKGEQKPVIIENEMMRAEIFPLGGRIGTVTLKNFKTHSQKPLELFRADSSHFGLEFVAALNGHESRPFNTDSLYFTAQSAGFSVSGSQKQSLTMRLNAGSPDKYIEYVYTLSGKGYLLDCKMNVVGMKDVFTSNTNKLSLQWSMTTPSQEQLVTNEQRYSSVGYFNNNTQEYDNISEGKYEKMKLAGDVSWVDFKQQYFSSILIADKGFPGGGEIETRHVLDPRYNKYMGMTMLVPYGGTASESFGMKFYFGPNDYHVLKSYNLEKSVYFGWWIIGGLNHYIIMPLFDWLASIFMNNMGLVILLLTIIVKIVIFPIAYRSYMSQAKMRVLKPEIDALNAKFKDGDPMQKQQAQMALYRKAGINPAAGCIPLLLQLPILFALIRFFPLAFDLRQQSFLWCPDLSSYDSIITFHNFSIPLYGDHVSLWALLMTASTLLYTWMNSQAMSSSASLPGMKVMMYVMPVFFLVFLNNYSAALSFYYFVANVINILQMVLMRRFVDEGKIRAMIEENKKKPAKQGRMQAYLDRMQKQQQERTKQLQQQKKKK